MKENLNALDIRVLTNELKDIITNKYIQNIYSHKQASFYFKLSSKEIIMVEAGIRIHLTDTKGDEISFFCKKLREKIRNCKIIDINQVGWDRKVIIDLYNYKIVMEFFSGGNIILLDKDDFIIEIYRPIPSLNIIKKEKYLFGKNDLNFNTLKDLPINSLFIDLIKKDFDESDDKTNLLKNFITNLSNKKYEGLVFIKNEKPNDCISLSYKEYKIKSNNDINENEIIYVKEKITNEMIEKEITRDTKFIEFNSFNQALNFLFSNRSKLKIKKINLSRGEKINMAQTKYVKKLTRNSERVDNLAGILEENRENISYILKYFKNVYDTKMTWSVFDEEFKKENDEILKLVDSYDLMKKKCTVVLENEKFVLDLSLNIDKNIQKLYNEKKKYDDKRIKTIEAMKNLSIKYEPKKKLEPQKREKYWFEKFNYFISKDRDETVLILGGMNAAQNDVIYNKYLQTDDIYLHCNVQGASSIIIKDTCKMKEEIKDKVMKEASYMALVMSKCWKEQTLSNVIWVQGNQVTKTIDNKTSPVGGFFLTGKQSFLYPPRIEYGIAIVFKIKDKSELYYETDVSDPVTIKHAMPINGPWCTLKSYKYSLRLCPGNLKKQKLAQSILGIFNKKCKDQTEEHFVNLIGLSEYMDVVLSKSRLSK